MGDEEYLSILRAEYRRVLDERTLPGRWSRAKGRLAGAGADAAWCEHCWRPVATHFGATVPQTGLASWRRSDWTWLVVLTSLFCAFAFLLAF
ncbi:MAG: hypothetical protein ACT4QG_21650 [Sporichthyaceae bacterium]